MTNTNNLTEGKIFSSLLRLALPIAGAQVMNMAYNITDMFWLGRVSAEALAATGASGLFLWLSVGLMIIGRAGAEIGVAQSRGKGDIDAAFQYSRTALYLSLTLGILYGSFIFFLRVPLIGFFEIPDAQVAGYAIDYLAVMAFTIPLLYMSGSIGGTFVASGNSRTPFIISSSGIVLNMILTPVFVFGLGLGVIGAAFASLLSQSVAFIALVTALKRSKGRPFETYRIRAPFSLSGVINDLRYGTSNRILRLTLPISVENTLFPLLTMVVTRIEVSFGAFALSMSRVAVQIESLSWLVGAGFGAALTAFVGQNFGAGKHDRISKGVRYSVWVLGSWGLFVTIIMWFGGDVVLAIFLPEFLHDPEMRRIFITLMRILAACQILSNIEFVGTNALRGKGKTMPPSIISISSNVLRVILAYIMSISPLGLMGVWGAVAFTAGLRGIAVYSWYLIDREKDKRRTQNADTENND